MTVTKVAFYASSPAYGNEGLCHVAAINGPSGQGMYSTANPDEITFLKEAVERFDTLRTTVTKLECEVVRLKIRNAKLRKRLPAKKPNRKAVAV